MNNNLLLVGGALFLWFLSNRKPERESVKATGSSEYSVGSGRSIGKRAHVEKSVDMIGRLCSVQGCAIRSCTFTCWDW